MSSKEDLVAEAKSLLLACKQEHDLGLGVMRQYDEVKQDTQAFERDVEHKVRACKASTDKKVIHLRKQMAHLQRESARLLAEHRRLWLKCLGKKPAVDRLP